jgi:hypothetical protein
MDHAVLEGALDVVMAGAEVTSIDVDSGSAEAFGFGGENQQADLEAGVVCDTS